MLKYISKFFRRMEYKHYLKSDKWQQKRLLVLMRDKFRCALCGSKKSLQVHHRTYEHIFNEPLSDLITLCRKCHKRQHDKGA